MNRSLRLIAVAALLTVGGGVLLLSLVLVFAHLALQEVWFSRSIATLPWAIVMLAAVAGACPSLMMLLDWINSETPPWVTDQPRRMRRIAAIGAVAWPLVALAFISSLYVSDGGWRGDLALPTIVSAVCIGVAVILYRVRGSIHG